jgi:SAM-dependent methyltransferase
MTELTHYEREKAYWDEKGAEDYATLSALDRRRIVDWVGWQGGGRILDLGGGSGMISRLLMEKPATQMACLDISHAMLVHSPVPGIQADAMVLPFATASFDLVVSAAFLHHLPGLEPRVLDEIQRVLTPGGRVVGYDPNGRSLQNRVFMGDSKLRLKSTFTPDERPIVPEHLGEQMRAAGFSSFTYEYFTFHNDTKTVFERIQTHVINPIAKGPLKKHLDRWFFWRATR